MHALTNRRGFIKTASLAGMSVAMPNLLMRNDTEPVKIGIIGLDTEHSVAFTKVFNDPNAAADVAGFRVVAAYPYGSRDIEFCVKAIPRYTEEMKQLGIPIVNSIAELLQQCDVVLLETNDGRLHAQQAMPVIEAGKPVFIDKPVAASLADALLIFDKAAARKVPVFTASSLRYMKGAQEIVGGTYGAVLGADTYSPATIEKTHPDLFWYGIHGVEALFTVMGAGCEQVTRYYTEGTDIVVGEWKDKRMGTFRGIRTGQTGLGGTAFCEKGIAAMGPWESYRPLVVQIAQFFRTGISPVHTSDTLEIFAFMEAAEESKRRKGATVRLQQMMDRAAQYNRRRNRDS